MGNDLYSAINDIFVSWNFFAMSSASESFLFAIDARAKILLEKSSS